MPNHSREQRAEAAPVLLAWGVLSLEAPDALFDSLTLWLTGGVALVVWTAVSVVLTS